MGFFYWYYFDNVWIYKFLLDWYNKNLGLRKQGQSK